MPDKKDYLALDPCTGEIDTMIKRIVDNPLFSEEEKHPGVHAKLTSSVDHLKIVKNNIKKVVSYGTDDDGKGDGKEGEKK